MRKPSVVIIILTLLLLVCSVVALNEHKSRDYEAERQQSDASSPTSGLTGVFHNLVQTFVSLVNVVLTSLTGAASGGSSESSNNNDTHGGDREPSTNGSGVQCGVENPNGEEYWKLARTNMAAILKDVPPEGHPFIVGGRDALPGEYPWQVRIIIDFRGRKSMCGGVVIHRRWILTAAHCMVFCAHGLLRSSRSTGQADRGNNPPPLPPDAYTAYTGDWNRTDNGEDRHAKHEIEEVIPHEDYEACGGHYHNDIGLLKTKQDLYEDGKPIMSSDGYGSTNRACLPEHYYEYEGEVVVTGWGRTKEGGSLPDILQTVNVFTIPTEECQEAYENVDETQICAGVPEGGKDSCQGDSGGPLVERCEDSERSTLLGLTSYGEGCARKGKPGVYTKVSHYMDWVERKTELDFTRDEYSCPTSSGGGNTTSEPATTEDTGDGNGGNSGTTTESSESNNNSGSKSSTTTESDDNGTTQLVDGEGDSGDGDNGGDDDGTTAASGGSDQSENGNDSGNESNNGGQSDTTTAGALVREESEPGSNEVEPASNYRVKQNGGALPDFVQIFN